MVGICIPTFVMGPLLILVFAIHFGWFNASGWYGPIDRVLPSLTLGLVYAAYVARLTRGRHARGPRARTTSAPPAPRARASSA